MNWDQIEGNWHQIKGKVKEKQGDLTDDDIARLEGSDEQLAGVIQEHYGIAREEARRQLLRTSNAAARLGFALHSLAGQDLARELGERIRQALIQARMPHQTSPPMTLRHSHRLRFSTATTLFHWNS